MTSESTPSPSNLLTLTDEEAVTLRRIAFGESELRSLRRADVERLLKLRLIVQAKGNMVLTASGKEHFEALPRALFAARPRQRDEY
jgi:hypothetical protein